MDLGEEPRGRDPPLPYFGLKKKKKKKESQKEEKPAGQAKKNRSPPLAQVLDLLPPGWLNKTRWFS